MKVLVNTTALKTQIIISQSLMKSDTTSDTEILGKDGTVSTLIYACFSKVDLEPPPI